MTSFLCKSIIILLLVSLNLFSQQKDTVKIRSKEIEVYGNYINSNNIIKYIPNLIINNKLIEKVSPYEINSVISLSPGVFLRDYGGAGGLKTVSIRGASSSETKLHINGIELNSRINGSFDLSLLPISLFENVEIIRGGSAIFYGSNSSAGVINFVNDYSKFNGLNFSINSIKEFNINPYFTIKNDNNLLSLHLDYRDNNGKYPISINNLGNKQIVERQNANSKQLSIALNYLYQFDKLNFETFLLGIYNDRGIPGAVLNGKIENINSKMKEKKFYGIIKTNYNIDNLLLQSSFTFSYGNMNYYDLEQIGLDGKPLESKFDNIDVKLSNKFKYFYILDHNIELSVSYSNLIGNMLQPKLGNKVDDLLVSLSYLAELNNNLNNTTSLSLFGGIRLDKYREREANLSSSIGFILNHSNLSILSNLSSNFRVPSFNEIYYLNYGNINLKTENNINTNFGINYNKDYASSGINIFYNFTYDKIQSIPISPVRWSATNIGKIESYGIEFNSNLNLFQDRLTLIFNYTLMSVKDKTPDSFFYNLIPAYTPLELLNIFISTNYKNLELLFSGNYSSYRYSLRNNAINSILKDYLLINLSFKYNFYILANQIKLIFGINNLFDTDYQIIKNYPMPGRMYSFTIKSEL
jgi:outer membrane cobalamin receptor